MAETSPEMAEPRFREVAENLHFPAFTLDIQGRVTFANPALVALTGYSEEEVIGADWFANLIPSEQNTQARQSFESITQGKLALNCESEIVTRNWGRRTISWGYACIRDDNGKICGASGIGQDLTEQRKAQADLLRGERLFDSFFQGATVGMAVLDKDTRYLQINETLARMNGVPVAEHIGRKVREVLPWLAEKIEPLLEKVMSTGLQVANVELIAELGQFSVFQHNCLVTVFPVMDGHGKPEEAGVVVLEVAEQKKTGQRVEALDSYSQKLIQSAPIAIITYRESGEVVAANPVAAQLIGGTAEQLTAQNFRQLESWKQCGLTEAALAALSSGELRQLEVHLFSSFGKELWLLSRLVPLKLGGETHLLCLFMDITESKHIEARLKEAQQFAQSTLDSLSAHIAILDYTGKILAVNRSWKVFAQQNSPSVEVVCEGTNYLHACDSANGEDAAAGKEIASGIRSVMAGTLGEFSLQYPCHSPTEKRWFVARVRKVLGEGHQRIVVAHENITERKLAEISLKESEAKFRQLAENINKVFWLCNKVYPELVYVSPAYERIWGRSCQSLYEDPNTFFDAVHADDKDRVVNALSALRRGENYEEEYRIVRPDGSERWIHDLGFIIRNDRGEIYRFAGLATDITKRKELESQLRQAQKMEAIGQLAGGVAHDFNNILAGTLMHLGLLEHNPQLTPSIRQALKEVELETMRAASLTRQLLLFSRRQAARIEPLELNKLIKELMKMLRRLLEENIDFSYLPNPEALWVEADPGMLEQVVMNLCVNARDAMPKGGRLTVKASFVVRDAASPITDPDARPGNFALLEFEDTGCGMGAGVLKHIFEPFFTTKEVGKGTGLGLATVFGIIKQHHGWIEVQSSVGKGSVFQVYLPALKVAPTGVSATSKPQKTRGGTETILFVEDDVNLRRTSSLWLRKLGYSVLEAVNGVDAIKVWNEHPGAIELLLTDMVMPDKMTGVELAEKLGSEKPSLRIIVCSGYSKELLHPEQLAPGVAFLAKPYGPVILAETIRQCLEKAV